MTHDSIRVGVVGAGLMGADHVTRIQHRVSGAHVEAIIEPDATRAGAAREVAPEARIFAGMDDALAAGAVDAVVIAVPGQFHEPTILSALEARVPVFCEKPLTPDPESSRRIVEAEQRLDKPHIQVGFMRRFDREYAQLRELIASGLSGELLMLHCIHRNAGVAEAYNQEMLITDSVVHELDAVPWLAGSPIRTIEVKYGRRNSLAPDRLREPILVLLELANGVLANIEMSVNIQFGYQVRTEAVFESGAALIGQPAGVQQWRDGQICRREHADFTTRFADAYDRELQVWVDAVRDGTNVNGPTAWDGYEVALACEAGLRALHHGGVVDLDQQERPAFYS